MLTYTHKHISSQTCLSSLMTLYGGGGMVLSHELGVYLRELAVVVSSSKRYK